MRLDGFSWLNNFFGPLFLVNFLCLKEAKEEDKKQEEEKKEEENGEKKDEEKKEEKKEEVPEEIVLKVDMHCEACARKVERSLRGFEG